MILLAVATESEIAPLNSFLNSLPNITPVITGVGILETAVTLCNFLNKHDNRPIDAVVNFGVGGAFIGSGPRVMDICLAEEEVLADFGVCFSDKIAPFDTLPTPSTFTLDLEHLSSVKTILDQHNIHYHCGCFATVNGVSGTAARGEILQKQYSAICENMEGAAVARVCQNFNIPCLEIRCISNMVEDRDISNWRLNDSIERGGEVLQIVLTSLLENVKD